MLHLRGLQAAHPDIPWSKIQRQRHRLAHDYDEVDDTLIWAVVTRHIPDLTTRIEPLVPPLPPGADPDAP